MKTKQKVNFLPGSDESVNLVKNTKLEHEIILSESLSVLIDFKLSELKFHSNKTCEVCEGSGWKIIYVFGKTQTEYIPKAMNHICECTIENIRKFNKINV